MKAIVYREYGSTDVLRLEEIEKPVVGDDDVLLRVHAASVNPIDWHFMRGSPYLLRLMFGLRKPRVARLGIDAAGKVDAVGRNVTQFKPGDEVFGACRGAFAEYACTPQSKLAIKPVMMTFEQAASVPVAALTALQGLRDEGGIRAGQKVLINGASGGVGTFAVQIARFFGADVTGVCSARNAEMVRSIGADRVIDYTVENFTQGGQRYDLIFDCMGNQPLGSCRRVLDRKGTYIVIGGPNGRWIGPVAPFVKAMIVSPFVGQKLAGFSAKETAEDLRFIGGLIEGGKVMPVIDRCYELSRIAEAVRYVEAGHARGKVIITLES
jgi:NADPH:quinone reductase-like Zn-dependent oxidoreductase